MPGLGEGLRAHDKVASAQCWGCCGVGLALVGCAGGPGPEAPSAFLVQKMRPLPTPHSQSGWKCLWFQAVVRDKTYQADPGLKDTICRPVAYQPQSLWRKGDGEGGMGMKPTLLLSVGRAGSQRWGLVIWRVLKTTSPSSAFVTEKSEGQRGVVSWLGTHGQGLAEFRPEPRPSVPTSSSCFNRAGRPSSFWQLPDPHPHPLAPEAAINGEG